MVCMSLQNNAATVPPEIDYDSSDYSDDESDEDILVDD